MEHLQHIGETGLLNMDLTRSSHAGPGQLLISNAYLANSIFGSAARSTDGITFVGKSLLGPTVIRVDAPWRLTVRDALLFGFIGQRYMCEEPEDRIVSFSLNQACRVMGYTTSGGKQRRQAAEAMRRLTATVTWYQADEAGEVEADFSWHLLDGAYVQRDPSSGASWVRLSEEAVGLLWNGLLANLKAPVARDIVNSDELAARLWLFLEAQRLWEGFHFPLIRCGAVYSRQRFIAEIMGIDGWTNERKIRARIRDALKVIEHVDPGRYSFVMTKNTQGVGHLKVTCFRR